MRVSIELVPRNEADLVRQLDEVRSHLPQVDTINLPDIHRFDMRSWDGCAVAKGWVRHVIPHIRAIDIDPSVPLSMAGALKEIGVEEVVVISGDVPVDMSRTVYGTSTLEVIRKVREELPGVRIYAALDPYRQGFQAELRYAYQKLEAGASGLFTQPFFDLRLMEVYADLLPNTDIFWGFTSVTSQRSMRYWQTRNLAVFPAGFEPNLAWCRALAHSALDIIRSQNGNVYFMPIRVGIGDYLGGLI